MRFHSALATLEPQKYFVARTVWTESILLVIWRLVINLNKAGFYYNVLLNISKMIHMLSSQTFYHRALWVIMPTELFKFGTKSENCLQTFHFSLRKWRDLEHYPFQKVSTKNSNPSIKTFAQKFFVVDFCCNSSLF